MDTQGQDFEAIWAETTDGGLLRQLFGAYPTMHNAVILGLDTDFSTRSITITVHYSDEVGEASQMCARINLIWTGVERADLPFADNAMMSLKFARLGNLIVSSIETSPGQFGEIVSESFEAVLKQVDPLDELDVAAVRYRLNR